jgi:predicted glycosyltransferase
VQERYSGLQELAYLHPDYFRPDAEPLRTLGLGPEEPYSVVRFVSWRATHDVGQRGFTDAQKRDAVERLGRLGRVFVSTEGERAPVPPERLHDLLAGARVYLGEGATMATEAGLLGTPSIYVSSLVGTMGNFETLRAESLVESFSSAAAALERATALAGDAAAKPAWQARARAFALRHDDVTDLVCRRLVELGAKRAALENPAGRA